MIRSFIPELRKEDRGKREDPKVWAAMGTTKKQMPKIRRAN